MHARESPSWTTAGFGTGKIKRPLCRSTRLPSTRVRRIHRTPQRQVKGYDMSEKRKPEMVLVAKFPGKPKGKRTCFTIELFHVSQWKDSKRTGPGWTPDSISMIRADAYRLRVGGKWYKPSSETPLTLSQVFSLFRRSLARARTEERSKPKREKSQPLPVSDP